VLLPRQAVHDELLQRGRHGSQLDGLLIFDKDQRQRFLQLSSLADQTKEKHNEEYDPAKDCLHVKCKVNVPVHVYVHSHNIRKTTLEFVNRALTSAILRVRRAAATHR
jgi:hypothetical protein